MHLTIILFCFIFTGLMNLHAALTISDIKFYKSKETRSTDQITGEHARERITRLSARFTIVGSADTLNHLKQHGYLKVTVDWRLDGRVVDSVEVGITQDKWELAEEDLSRQVSEDGLFRYRTCTYKTYVPIGRYELSVRDADGNILSPPGFQGPGVYQPTIKIIPP